MTGRWPILWRSRPPQLEPTLSEGLRNLILSISQPFNQPFARELWITDPPALLAAVTVPVLILIGKKDIQVDWQTDGPLFEALAQAHPNIEVVYAPAANHVLKHEARAGRHYGSRRCGRL